MHRTCRPPARARPTRPALVVLLAAALVMAACAGHQSYREATAALAAGQTETGLAKLQQAMAESPGNNEFRRSYFTQRERALDALVHEAETALQRADFGAARQAYARARQHDPGSARAAAGAERVDRAEQLATRLDAAETLAREGRLDAALEQARQVLADEPRQPRAAALMRRWQRLHTEASGKALGLYPQLDAAYRVPVSLSFHQATLGQVLQALKQASGLNYLIERDVRTDLRVTLSVTNKSVDDVLRLLLATHQLERRVLDKDTLLIYPNTPAKAAEYREMVVRHFYLSHADAAKVANVLRTIAKARDVVIDEKLNLVILRDSADVIRLAEKLVATQDLPDPEVVLELEVLEVNANRLLELGLRWPDQISAGVIGSEGIAGQLRLEEFRNRSSELVRLRFNDPLASARLRSQKGDADLLANPRVRVRNRQSAKILIGERVPVITTTTTANVGSSESVSYLDVGLKLEIEPSVSLDDEVAMKIALEVSSILETVTRSTGTQVYRLGTRNTVTSLRVRDGETNVLAGLIQREERRANTGLPGLNEIPLLGKLFGMAQDSDTRTEIVLLITPRIVRNLEPPGAGLLEFLSGTESAVGAAPIQLAPLPPPRPAAATPSATGASK
ncbi:general secretion pathway protein GspD [Aquincola sp. S2]|uniref:General secretion pathway protein GspD n=1 Tax=Pseudaquabacterium terrae TaxID=2732868 RepID=A0ABX2EJW5_9BURK|nr:secretin N-terminal domain-containing protein [Aquabacterium terrae]NRF68881.1 general secretion pathway protein GspD [Aquabacterium terrae]